LNKTKILVTISSALILTLLATTLVVAPVHVGTLYSCPADPVPTVDGSLGAIEWKEGVPLTVKLYNLAAQADTMEIEIMSLYDNDNRIYFGITYLDDKINPEDNFWMVFKSIEGDPLCFPPHNASGMYGLNHDMKFIHHYSNKTIDGYTMDTLYYNWLPDDPPGVDNGIGKCHENGTHVTIEMRFPFNSGDSLGADFALAVNASVEFFVGFHDEDKHIDWFQIREADNDFDYIKLQVSCTAVVPVPVISILLGLMMTSVIAVLYKKKRK